MQACADEAAVAEAFAARGARWPRPTSAPAACSSSGWSRPARHVEVQVFGDGTGRRRGPRRPGLLAAAPQPEGHRGGPGARAAAGAPPPAARGGPRPGRVGRLPLGRHGRVRVRPGAAGGLVPRGQRPAAGRAPGHRGGLRRRPRRVDAPPGRPGPDGVARFTGARHVAARRTPSRPASTPRTPAAAAPRAPAWSPSVTFARPPASAWTPGSRPGPRCRRIYDPMLAKVIARGADRDAALDALRRRARRHPRRRHRRPTSACCAPSLAGERRRARAAPLHLHARRGHRPRAAHRGARAAAPRPPCRTGPDGSGYWQVGVPPSRPDGRRCRFRAANRARRQPRGRRRPGEHADRARPCGSPRRR